MHIAPTLGRRGKGVSSIGISCVDLGSFDWGQGPETGREDGFVFGDKGKGVCPGGEPASGEEGVGEGVVQELSDDGEG